MNRKASQSRKGVLPTEREELLEAMLVEKPELRFTPRGDPDPRLVRLVEFLARQAAREFFEKESKRQGSRGS
ncbi:hypothetical protein [Chelativorans alearense]|uniref:hypothetical protein n=1 Tax=Chelativorans alearense TaxID=2681495 RepID=UPI0013D5DB77|nr:hypothetical protein [Chelativorans alearense]